MAVGRPKYAPRRDAEAVAVAMDTGAVLSARRRFAGGLWKLCPVERARGNVFGNVAYEACSDKFPSEGGWVSYEGVWPRAGRRRIVFVTRV